MTTLISVVSGGVTSSILVKRPKFDKLWTAYKEVGNKDFEEVYSLIGGNIYQLRKERPGSFTNACALRMSRAMNYGGYKIPSNTIIKGTNIYRAKGGDGLAYIIRVVGVVDFVTYNWGQPDLTMQSSEIAKINGKKGLIVINIQGWTDATGHAVLWDGSQTSDGSHYQSINSDTYNNPDVKLKSIHFWELK